MFKTGDMVLYGPQGVCRIEAVEKKNFGKENREYYVLRPVYEKTSVIYVPIHNAVLTARMKRVLTVDKIHEMIDSMPQQELLWIENENERKQRYRAILERGDRGELVRMIKTLYLVQKQQAACGKKLHMADERYFKEAEKLLYDEFALVLGIDREQVLPFILQKLPEERLAQEG